jgi:hypothetical protein
MSNRQVSDKYKIDDFASFNNTNSNIESSTHIISDKGTFDFDIGGVDFDTNTHNFDITSFFPPAIPVINNTTTLTTIDISSTPDQDPFFDSSTANSIDDFFSDIPSPPSSTNSNLNSHTGDVKFKVEVVGVEDISIDMNDMKITSGNDNNTNVFETNFNEQEMFTDMIGIIYHDILCNII